MTLLKEKNTDLDVAAKEYYKKSGPDTLNKLIEAGGRLVSYFARIYSGGLYNEDMRQVGVEGLLKAIRRYNPNMGASFTTYAGHYIMGEMRHYIRNERSFYRPGCIKDLQYRVECAIEEYLKKTGEVPTDEFIAKKLNIRKESVSEVMKAGLVNIDEISLYKIHSRYYEHFALPIEDRIALAQAIKRLSELHRKVIYLLFYRDMTQEQAAKQLGINQRKVSRLRKRCLTILRELLVEN